MGRGPENEKWNVGLRPERTVEPGEGLQGGLAQSWFDLMRDDPGLFSKILGRPATKRDRQVAATVIQWLGTTIGERFLRRVLREHDAIAANQE